MSYLYIWAAVPKESWKSGHQGSDSRKDGVTTTDWGENEHRWLGLSFYDRFLAATVTHLLDLAANSTIMDRPCHSSLKTNWVDFKTFSCPFTFAQMPPTFFGISIHGFMMLQTLRFHSLEHFLNAGNSLTIAWKILFPFAFIVSMIPYFSDSHYLFLRKNSSHARFIARKILSPSNFLSK
jgi:hypothetical protein